jgi:hypothetical protein
LDEYAISTTTCPVLPSFPDAVVVYTSQIDVDLEEGERNSTVLDHGNNFHFYNFSDAVVMTDGPQLECEGFNITHFESTVQPGTYKSSAFLKINSLVSLE